MKTICLIWGIFVSVLLTAGNVSLVKDGKSDAVIVIADDAVISAQYAAKELAYYIEKATGAALPVVREAAVKKRGAAIFIGNTAAARKAGLTQDKFPGEAFTIQERNGDLYIAGGEDTQKLFYEPAASGKW